MSVWPSFVARLVNTNKGMTSFVIGGVLIVIAVTALAILLARMNRQVGGGFGPTELSDGSMTTSPTGYPEEMKGRGKKISATDNNAASV